MGDAPPATDSWSRFLTAQTAFMMLALKLRPKYRSLVNTNVDLGTNPYDMGRRPHWHGYKKIDFRFSKYWRLRRLQMQWFPNRQMCKIFKKKRPMPALPEPAFDTLDVQDAQKKRPLSEPAPNTHRLISEPDPHTSAKRHCVSQGAPLEVLSPAHKITAIPLL